MSIDPNVLADKIVATAETRLALFDAMMKDWPADFRAIMWDAVVKIAQQRAADARKS
jgi:hypothetical protein